jgi:hypothetical protein
VVIGAWREHRKSITMPGKITKGLVKLLLKMIKKNLFGLVGIGVITHIQYIKEVRRIMEEVMSSLSKGLHVFQGDDGSVIIELDNGLLKIIDPYRALMEFKSIVGAGARAIVLVPFLSKSHAPIMFQVLKPARSRFEGEKTCGWALAHIITSCFSCTFSLKD